MGAYIFDIIISSCFLIGSISLCYCLDWRDSILSKRHWLDLKLPGQQQKLLLSLWKQDKMIISKKYALLGATAFILVEIS